MEKFTLITESYENERKELFNKFKNLGTWLYKSTGLGLIATIDKIFLEQVWTDKISFKEVANFNKGLDLLNKSSMDKNWIKERMQWKLPGGKIENARLVKDNLGEWHPVNKLNTNHSDLSDMLTELIIRSLKHNPEKGEIAYNNIMNDVKGTLLSWKPNMKKLLEKYFIELGEGLDDFKKFTRFSKKFSSIGEANEDKIVTYLEENGFKILYQGGNGDFIDMIFGVDLIVFKEEFEIKTIQVKTNIKWESVKYYKVDWIASGNERIIYNKKTGNKIIIEDEFTTNDY